METTFWHGRRCLVTGADGFLAVHLAARLIESGALVYGLVRNRTRIVSRLDLFDIRSKMALITCDLRDFRGLLDIISGEDIDTVFHVGASAIVGAAARSPLDTWETNIIGTSNLLDACRLARSVRRIIVASSDKAYGDHRDHLPYREAYALRGLQIYECSKSCADLIAQTYYYQFHLPVRVTRCCNIFGPGDINFSRLVPGTIARLMENECPIIRPGQADVKREYIYVTDAVDAYLRIAVSIPESDVGGIDEGEREGFRCAYNVGSGDDHVKTVRQMIELISAAMGKEEAIAQEKHKSSTQYGELSHQYLDCAKIRDELGWRAATSLREGLLKTIGWYWANKAKLRPLYMAEIGKKPA